MNNFNPSSQSGFSLAVALIILLVMSIVGISVMNSGILSQKMSSANQEHAMTFQAAQTANSTYISAYQYDQKHLLDTADKAFWDDLSAPRAGYSKCTNNKGALVQCSDDVRLESDQLLKAEVEAFYHDCETAALKCMGNSWDNSGLGCHSFQLLGEGILDLNKDGKKGQGEINTNIEEWVQVVRSCNKTLAGS
ncbi:MAG: hypothetical protein HWE16_18140 [Gammaproteobacteria bacterium]|nr:hypothetical protein [Gammaproteobacteria bacterium]